MVSKSASDLVKEKGALINYWTREGILTDERIIAAFRKVKRENFVHSDLEGWAYLDQPLEIGSGQTISQPTTVAIMTQALEPAPGNKVLEVGAGSGYQAAILAEVVGKSGRIITVERIKSLFLFAKRNLRNPSRTSSAGPSGARLRLGYKNVKITFGDAIEEIRKLKIKFDRIIVTAAAEKFPNELFDKLNEGGIMIAPIGTWDQHVFRFTKIKGKKYSEDLGPFIFVPLVEGKIL